MSFLPLSHTLVSPFEGFSNLLEMRWLQLQSITRLGETALSVAGAGMTDWGGGLPTVMAFFAVFLVSGVTFEHFYCPVHVLSSKPFSLSSRHPLRIDARLFDIP